MKMRIARGVTVAIAAGLVVSGGAAIASGAHPAASIKWTEGKAFPTTATRFDGATVDGKVYFLGFRVDDAGTTDGSVWSYDIKKGKYTDTGVDMPTPISNYAIAAIKTKAGVGLYTIGGRDADGAIITTVQVYYPATNKTAVLKKDPWPGMTPSDCVSLPGTGVTVVNDTAYVLGGMSFSTSVPACVDDNSKQVWAFDPSAKPGKMWKQQPDMKVALGYVAPAVLNGTIYAIGGDLNDAGTLTAQPTVQGWKVGSKKWSDTDYADLSQGCDESQAFAYDSGPLAGTITLAGCGQWPNALPDVAQYTAKKNKWASAGAMNEARRNQAGADIGTAKAPKMMIAGGYNSDGSAILDTTETGAPGKFAGFAGVFAKPTGTAKVSAF